MDKSLISSSSECSLSDWGDPASVENRTVFGGGVCVVETESFDPLLLLLCGEYGGLAMNRFFCVVCLNDGRRRELPSIKPKMPPSVLMPPSRFRVAPRFRDVMVLMSICTTIKHA
jgi:hypothetical protein